MCHGAHHTMPLMPIIMPTNFLGGMGSSNSRKLPARIMTVFMCPTCAPDAGVSVRVCIEPAQLEAACQKISEKMWYTRNPTTGSDPHCFMHIAVNSCKSLAIRSAISMYPISDPHHELIVRVILCNLVIAGHRQPRIVTVSISPQESCC